jgi:hypothetical protein
MFLNPPGAAYLSRSRDLELTKFGPGLKGRECLAIEVGPGLGKQIRRSPIATSKPLMTSPPVQQGRMSQSAVLF